MSSSVTITPNMGLPNPVPGVDSGPDWANQIYSSFSIVDSHSHVAGSGVPITPSAINISADLPFYGNNATLLRSARFQSQSSPITGTAPDLGCVYVSGVDLYYNDGSGNQIRITQSGTVAGSSGTITGLPSGTASASYASSSGSFVFQQSTSTAANLDVATLTIRYPGSYPTPAGNYISIQAPSALATGYAFTLPTTTPAASNAFLLSSTAGVVSYANVDNSTIEVASTTVQVKDSGITTPKLAPGVALPVGTILDFAGSSAPTGFLLCYGQAVSRTTYSGLFSVLSTTYGSGDGSTTFNIPDLRGRSSSGKDNMGGSSANRITSGGSGITGTTLGATGGEQTHTLITAEIPNHNHTIQVQLGPTGTTYHVPPVDSFDDYQTLGTSYTGGGGAHQNMQPTIILSKIIKY